MKKVHPLHKATGELLKEFASNNNFEERLDEACGGKQRISLFKGKKSNESNFCDVDAILLKHNKIAVVIEIEESKHIPTTIFGKYLTTAMSDCHIRGNSNIRMAEKSVGFIQIIDTKKVEAQKNTDMIKKFHLIENEINKHSCGCVKSYNIICVDGSKLKEDKEFEKFKKAFIYALKNII